MPLKFLLAAVVSATLVACASSGPKIDASSLTELRRGETTLAQVVGRFGRPSILSKNMDGTQTAAYMHAGDRNDATAFVPLVAALAGSSSANVDSVIFHFDGNGVLQDYKTTHAKAPPPAQVQAKPAAQATTAGTPSQPAASQSARVAAGKPAPADNTPPAEARPWTIQLHPSGYRENR